MPNVRFCESAKWTSNIVQELPFKIHYVHVIERRENICHSEPQPEDMTSITQTHMQTVKISLKRRNKRRRMESTSRMA